LKRKGHSQETKNKIGDKNRYNYEYVKDYIKSQKYKLLSKEYKNNKIKIELQCPMDHIFWMAFDCFKNKGSRCPICARKIEADKQRLPYKQVNSIIEKENHILLSKTYKNYDTKLELKCPNNHVFWITLNNFVHNRRCPICAINNKSGDKCHLWRGGISTDRRKIMNSEEYKQWRNMVYQKDNFICQKCNKRGENLNAHHLLNFSDNIDLRFDINNGVTLCNDCHSPNIVGSFHNTYGTKNNTKEQFLEYIN